jgi:hypothetical protein
MLVTGMIVVVTSRAAGAGWSGRVRHNDRGSYSELVLSLYFY